MLTAEKLKDGVMSLKHMSTKEILSEYRGKPFGELKDMLGSELEVRYDEIIKNNKRGQ